MANKFHGGIKAGSTSVSLPIELRISSSSLEKTGAVYTDVTAYYCRQGASPVSITMASLASSGAAFSAGGFVEDSSTNMPGHYRFDVPDAAFATGADWVKFSIRVSGCFAENFFFPLEQYGTQEIASVLPLGTTAGSAGGLQICGSNAATTYATLTVAGATSLNTLAVSGTTSLNAVTTSGTVTFNNFGVTGHFGMNSLGVTGTATLGALTVSGATSLAALSTSGTTTLAALTVTGALTVGGNTNIQTAATRLLTAIELDGSVYRFTTNALEQAPTGSGSGPTAVQIRDELDANSTKLARLDVNVSSRKADFSVPASFATADFTRLDVAVSTRNATAPPSAAAIADAVWDEPFADHNSNNATFGFLEYAAAITTNTQLEEFSAFSLQVINALVDDANAVQPTIDKLASMLEADGLVYRFTANALEQGPSGGGGGGTATLENQVAILAALSGVAVTVASPISPTGNVISVLKGDGYYNSEGRALLFTVSGIDMTGGTVRLKVDDVLSVTGTVLTATTCRFELSETNTNSLTVGNHDYQVEATLLNGHIVTPVDGVLCVEEGL